MRPTQITASMRIEDYYGSVWKDIFFSCKRRDKYLISVATSLPLYKYCLAAASSNNSYKLEYMNKIAFVFLLKIAMRIESSKIKWKSSFQAKYHTWTKKKKKKNWDKTIDGRNVPSEQLVLGIRSDNITNRTQ